MDSTIIVRDFAYKHPPYYTPCPKGPRHRDSYVLIVEALVDINQPTLSCLDPVLEPQYAPYRTWFIERKIYEEAWLEKHVFLPLPAPINRATRQLLWRHSRYIRKGYRYSDIRIALLRLKDQDPGLFGQRPTMKDPRKPFDYIAEQEMFLTTNGYLPIAESTIEERIRADKFATTMKDLEIASYQGRLISEFGDLERIAVPLFDAVERDLPQGTGWIAI